MSEKPKKVGLTNSGLLSGRPLKGHYNQREWETSSAYYGRLSVGSSPEITRPIRDFTRSNDTSLRTWGVPGHSGSSFLRRDLLDLGHVQTRAELGKKFI